MRVRTKSYSFHPGCLWLRKRLFNQVNEQSTEGAILIPNNEVTTEDASLIDNYNECDFPENEGF